MKNIKFLTIVVLKDWYIKKLKKINDHRFDKDNFFLYFGEIPNMKEHCVVCGLESGKIYSGYHIENFRVATEEEA